jgi:hypothetical protein
VVVLAGTVALAPGSRSPTSRVPPLPLGPSLDRGGLPHRPDAVDSLGLRELPFGIHLRPSLVRHAKERRNVSNAKGATLAHGPSGTTSLRNEGNGALCSTPGIIPQRSLARRSLTFPSRSTSAACPRVIAC